MGYLLFVLEYLLFPFLYPAPVLAFDVRLQVRYSFPSECVTGPESDAYPLFGCIGRFDTDGDCDIDLRDVAYLHNVATMPPATDVTPDEGAWCTLSECMPAIDDDTSCWHWPN